MKALAGAGSEVHFTHLSNTSCDTLASLFESSSSREEGQAFAHPEGVLELMKHKGISLDKVCLLDPRAEKQLAPEDGNGRFEWFLFGVSLIPKLACWKRSDRYTGNSWYVSFCATSFFMAQEA